MERNPPSLSARIAAVAARVLVPTIVISGTAAYHASHGFEPNAAQGVFIWTPIVTVLATFELAMMKKEELSMAVFALGFLAWATCPFIIAVCG